MRELQLSLFSYEDAPWLAILEKWRVASLFISGKSTPGLLEPEIQTVVCCGQKNNKFLHLLGVPRKRLRIGNGSDTLFHLIRIGASVGKRNLSRTAIQSGCAFYAKDAQSFPANVNGLEKKERGTMKNKENAGLFRQCSIAGRFGWEYHLHPGASNAPPVQHTPEYTGGSISGVCHLCHQRLHFTVRELATQALWLAFLWQYGIGRFGRDDGQMTKNTGNGSCGSGGWHRGLMDLWQFHGGILWWVRKPAHWFLCLLFPFRPFGGSVSLLRILLKSAHFVQAAKRVFEKQRNEVWKHVLTIAGSDTCGGAGIQADLEKYFSAQGTYGRRALLQR